MTKRLGLLWLALLSVMLPIELTVAAEPFKAGTDYIELPFPQTVETGDRIEVREFFWYGCPHCYAFEPALSAYAKKLPAHVRFIRTPGTAPSWLMQAQAFYTFEVLGVAEKLHLPFFEAWHVKNRRLNDEASIAEFAAEHGVDKAKFKQAFDSFAVRSRMEHAQKLMAGFMIEGVPTIAVDGRYVTSPTITKSETATLKVIDFLIQKAAKQRKKPAIKD